MTPRQRLSKSATRRVSVHNIRAILQQHGKEFFMEFGGKQIPVIYTTIKPDGLVMNEIVEDVAKYLGDDTWDYYLNLSDFGYRRLANEIFRRS